MSTYKAIFNVPFEKGDVIIDLGANLGIISILLSKKYPHTKIYSYEASPINYSNFVRNIQANGCTNITPFNLAVWSKSGEIVKIPTSPTNSGGSSIFYKEEFFKQYPVSDVATISLNDVFAANSIEHCKLLKVDIEGSEYEAFSTFEKSSYNRIRNLAIEYHQCAAASTFDLEAAIKNANIRVVCKFTAQGSKLA